MTSAADFFKKLESLSTQDLLEIKGVGDVIAQNFKDFLSSKRYIKLIEKFEKLEQKNQSIMVTTLLKNSSSENLPLSGELVCITGTFEIGRNEIKTKLEDKGAKVVDTVTSKTTILLAGENSGSKLDKAKKLNVKIVYELSDLI